jgi:hypothetical protein
MKPGEALKVGILGLGPLCLASSSSRSALAGQAEGASSVLLADEPPFYIGSAMDAVVPPRSGKKRGHGSRPYHPAPGIIVDVLDESGAVATALQRSARNLGYWPFRRCYEEGLRRNQALTGTVSFDLWVRPDGSVERTEVTTTTVKDEVVGACVAREALGLAFSPVESSRPSPAEVTMAKARVQLALGDELVPGPALVPRAEQLRASLRDEWSALQTCYRDALARHPDAGGRMELRFELTEDGSVARVEEGATHFPDAEATRCVVGAYRGAALPDVPRELRGKGFVYPLHFEPRSSVIPVRP